MGTIREWSDDDLNSKGTIPDRFSCKTNSRWSFFHPLKSLINPRYHIQTHSAALLECVSQFSIARNARIRKSTVLARNRNYQDHHPHYLELFWGISKERKKTVFALHSIISKSPGLEPSFTSIMSKAKQKKMFLWKRRLFYCDWIYAREVTLRMVEFQLQLNADPFNHFGKFLLLSSSVQFVVELNFCRQLLLQVTLQNQLCAINQAANILA